MVSVLVFAPGRQKRAERVHAHLRRERGVPEVETVRQREPGGRRGDVHGPSLRDRFIERKRLAPFFRLRVDVDVDVANRARGARGGDDDAAVDRRGEPFKLERARFLVRLKRRRGERDARAGGDVRLEPRVDEAHGSRPPFFRRRAFFREGAFFRLGVARVAFFVGRVFVRVEARDGFRGFRFVLKARSG